MKHHEPTDGLNSPALVTWGVISAIGTFVVIVAMQALFLNFQSARQDEQNALNTVTSATSLLAEQRAKINRYGWLDREKGIVAIPIDRAIELTAKEMQGVPKKGTSDGR